MVNPVKTRRAGVILHPTSLPGTQACGSLGTDAERWIDWLAEAGFRVWQMLPLTPVADGSPYNSYSAFAGNPALIDIQQLQQEGFPAPQGLDPTKPDFVLQALEPLHSWFEQAGPAPLREAFADFVRASHDWLDDFCIFSVIKEQHPTSWVEWPAGLRDRLPAALDAFHAANAKRIDLHRLAQFLFARQWQAIRSRAHQRDIMLFGDLPIFVAHDSVDVWCHRHLFKLAPDGNPQVVAGVPPDYFSATGQRWGNPLYDWPRHEADGFAWWQQRIRHALTLYDAIRIDHFRGFVAGWEIPRQETTAINGQWVEAPGDALFAQLQQAFGSLPLIAEDLGIITRDVIALRKKYGMPGMKILQFAFDSDGSNPYLPHHHTRDSVVYTGTHDNNTTVGWYEALPETIRARIALYYANPSLPMPWPLIHSALASPARWAVVPLQDLLEFDASHRMNTPGTTEGNWQWRFHWSQLPPSLGSRLHALNRLYQRLDG